MLAARDQENLVHGQQAAAASKPLNQDTGQLLPKTPGNKLPKTPFGLPLYDENMVVGFEVGKIVSKLNGKGNDNKTNGGKKGLGEKNPLITPIGPRMRAPLGLKTTNAKAKVFQTPATRLGDNDELDNATQKTATARKTKPRASHAEMTKVDVLRDKSKLEEREIEYMPPRPKNLPDVPDDLPDLDFSMFENGGMTRGYLEYYRHKPDHEGLSFAQREERKQKELFEKIDKKYEAMLLRDAESSPYPCIHYPECPGEECKISIENRKKAEEKYQKTMAALLVSSNAAENKYPITKGPSTLSAKTAASALSRPKPVLMGAKSKDNAAAPASKSKSKLPSSLLSSRKKTPPPTNPSLMRHTAAAAASKTTVGYSKGRAASTNLRKTILPKTDGKSELVPGVPDNTLAPALYIQRYGVPTFGSDMWTRCKSSGCFDAEDEEREDFWDGKTTNDYFQETERDFQLTW